MNRKEIYNKIIDQNCMEKEAERRYKFIDNIIKNCVIKSGVQNNLSQKIDNIVLNRWLAIPIFIAIMFAVYFLSVGVVGVWAIDWVGNCIKNFGVWVGNGLDDLSVNIALKSLVVDGIIAGVGAVLSFLPQLIMLFLCLGILEQSGYMSRVAFIFDAIFEKLGLSGKSLIPFIIGSGCSVPAILSCRTIENQSERKKTAMLVPFIPCNAKLPIIALFSGYFFPQYSGLVAVSMYFLAILIIIIVALFLKDKHENNIFLLELTPYKKPEIKTLTKSVYIKCTDFIKKIGTVILCGSIVIWFLLSFDLRFQYGVQIQDSIIAKIGNLFGWFFYPFLGTWSWAAVVLCVMGILAKEQIVSGMAIIAGLTSEGLQSLIFSTSSAFSFFTPASAISFMVFNLFCIPCINAVGALKSELGTKAMWKAIFLQTAVAWVSATLIYNLGCLI